MCTRFIFEDDLLDPKLTPEEELLAEDLMIASSKVLSKKGLLTNHMLKREVAKQMAQYLSKPPNNRAGWRPE